MDPKIEIAYIIAASLFILGIKGLTKPKTAVKGNQLAAMGIHCNSNMGIFAGWVLHLL